MLDKFAEELKAAREKNEITLQQIAQKSRIDLKFIEAIDRGDFSFLPELYVKAFVKQYARIVGLDEQVTIKKYEAAKKGKSIDDVAEEEKIEKPEKPAETEKTKQPVEEKKPEPPKVSPQVKSFQENQNGKPEAEPQGFSEKIKNDRMLLGGIIGGVIVVAFALVYFFFIRTSSDIIVAEKPYEEVRKENQQRYIPETKTESTPEATAVAPADSLTLELISSDTSWIKIKIDDKSVEEFRLFPNTEKTIKAAFNFSMIIGNAGGTKIKLNDKELNFTGKKNEVRYVSIDKNGLKYINTPPTF